MIPENLEPQKVTIEDILRLKRAERPSPEFWGRFEQELRAKQLAAIVEKRPWWVALRVPQIARSLSRFQVPVGAAAVLVLSFVVVREYRPLAISAFSGFSQVNAPIESSAGSHGKTVTSVALPLDKTAIERPASVTVPALDTNARVAHVAGASVLVPSVDEPASVGPGGLMAMIPWAPQTTSVSAEKDPVVLGELSPVYFLPVAGSSREHDFEGRVEVDPAVMPVRVAIAENTATVQPAVALISPREVRRNRILSNLAVADASEIDHSRLMQVREVLASALDDDRLYDSVRRLGMGGDRLTLKF